MSDTAFQLPANRSLASGALLAEQPAGVIYSFANFAEMLQLDTSTTPALTAAFVAGGVSPADGQGGLFLWLPLGQQPPDGVNILSSPTGVQPGVWQRLSVNGGTFAHSTFLTPEQFGADPTGQLDAVAACQACDAAAVAQNLEVRAFGAYLIYSENLNLSANWSGQGNWAGAFRNNNQYTNQKSCFIINPSYTINTMGENSLRGFFFQASNLVLPTSYRTAIQAVAAFAGTAVTIVGKDTLVENCMFVGFQYAVKFTAAGIWRPKISNCRFDCTAGIFIDGCQDIAVVNDCEAFPFLCGNESWTYLTWNVANVTNNGAGLIRVTLATPNTTLITGDTVWVPGVIGVTTKGRQVATVIDQYNIDLQGSTFSGAYISGGVLWATSEIRSGAALAVTNTAGINVKNFFAFQHDVGVDIGDGVTLFTANGLALDGKYNLYDDVSVGITFGGTSAGCNISGGSVTSQGTPLIFNSAPAGPASSISNMNFGDTNAQFCIDVQSGVLLMNNCTISGNIHIADGAIFSASTCYAVAASSLILGSLGTGVAYIVASPGVAYTPTVSNVALAWHRLPGEFSTQAIKPGSGGTKLIGFNTTQPTAGGEFLWVNPSTGAASVS